MSPSSSSSPSPSPFTDQDLQTIRADFPILTRTVHKDKPLVYLDNAASAQKPRAVIDSMTHLYEHDYANIHRGVHALSNASTNLFEAARKTTQRFINAASENEIIFTRGATESINLVAQTWGRQNLKDGDEILISALEHHANIVPWQILATERNITIKLTVIPLDPSGQIILEEAERLLTTRANKIKLLAVSHMSNALGTLLPVKTLIDLAHKHGIPALIDGCQAITQLPAIDTDMQALDADFYAFSGHKLYGPTGIGILYGKKHLLDTLPPWQGGGDMIDTVTFERTTYKPAPQRFEAGTPAIAEVIGLAAAMDYVESIGRDKIHAHEQALLAHATERLAALPNLTLHGTAKEKGAILSFTATNAHPQDLGFLLDQQGIAIRVGHHCCMPLMQTLGITGTCRASFALYNTNEEVDAFTSALEKSLKMLA